MYHWLKGKKIQPISSQLFLWWYRSRDIAHVLYTFALSSLTTISEKRDVILNRQSLFYLHIFSELVQLNCFNFLLIHNQFYYDCERFVKFGHFSNTFYRVVNNPVYNSFLFINIWPFLITISSICISLLIFFMYFELLRIYILFVDFSHLIVGSCNSS